MTIRISDIIICILFIASVILFLWYIFGNSPSFEQMILVFILTVLFTNSIKLNKLGLELKYFKQSFHSLADDFKNHIKHK